MAPKPPFDIHTVLRRIREAVSEHADAAMFELAERGFKSVFQQLVACIISIRTRDEVSLPTAIKLLERAPTPAAVGELSVSQIDALIRASSFHEAKAAQIREIARRVVDEFGGELPCDFNILTSFRGVGPKCANLTMGVACGAERISVDIHVHRVTNRWGYIAASSPEGTMRALEEKLPRTYWIEINRLLVPFGKHICTGRLPKCSTCPVLVLWLSEVIDHFSKATIGFYGSHRLLPRKSSFASVKSWLAFREVMICFPRSHDLLSAKPWFASAKRWLAFVQAIIGFDEVIHCLL